MPDECSRLARSLVRHGMRTVLVDGRSGSGKTSFAAALRAAWVASDVNASAAGAAPVSVCSVVHLDDVYPGWDGLRWASDHVRADLLEPRAQGRPGRWRQWDWATNRPGPIHVVPADVRLIVEGVGSLTCASRRLADVAFWVEAPTSERRIRALRRDGELYAPHWARWSAQEDAFIERERPRDYADGIVDNAATRDIAAASSRWVVHSSIGTAPSER
ncbi:MULTISPECIES: hypothetical protein [unclassified Pseudoclavibacter]|uniref:hypothetical protein n=1 Tax=unclassified Pseudoclavibacter TaxID=2615177 RepID=UPI001300D5E4|nr:MULTISPECIES: hypothetical protein [unclassified Pseudoclavibacter]KAB1644469.1 hypothetical protein F8O06_10565 [Pseudoclavibacter sp. CFCC 14310]KAB1664027.1 hypothetical protein F8O08_00955 [Pseudoclavibacter sp. CFCC 13611]